MTIRPDLPAALPQTVYRHMAQACLLIALDNGGIHRERSVEDWATAYLAWMFAQTFEVDISLPAIDAWLGALSEEDFETVCCGEHTEMTALLEKAPKGTTEFLEDYFNEVC